MPPTRARGGGFDQDGVFGRARRLTRRALGELMGDPDPEKSKRVTDAMLKMQKIIVADLQKAYDG